MRDGRRIGAVLTSPARGVAGPVMRTIRRRGSLVQVPFVFDGTGSPNVLHSACSNAVTAARVSTAAAC